MGLISGLNLASTYAYDADGRMATQSVLRRNEANEVEDIRGPKGWTRHDTEVKVWVAEAWRAI